VKSVDAGRVQVEFPWLDQAYQSHWAPIATPLAGKERGQFFMPEVGDEVLVAFEHGDFDHPFVVGFLWNGVDKPPETELKNRVILTPGKHTLRFEDKDGAKKIVLKSSDGHHVTLDDEGKKITVSDSDGNNKMVIDITGGKIKIEAGTEVTVEAPLIHLVDSSTHPLVFGDILQSFLSAIVIAFNSHTHPYFATPAPIFQPVPGNLLSTKVKTG
jgi:uncharacterized protein involved in type VI secretion and phage assembly